MTLRPGMVTIDCVDPRSLVKFWTEATGYTVHADFDGFFVILAAADDAGLRLGLQKVPEEKVGKNRVHIDWVADDRVVEVDRLVSLGATVVAEHAMPALTWTVLNDPAGNEFCVAGGS